MRPQSGRGRRSTYDTLSMHEAVAEIVTGGDSERPLAVRRMSFVKWLRGVAAARAAGSRVSTYANLDTAWLNASRKITRYLSGLVVVNSQGIPFPLEIATTLQHSQVISPSAKYYPRKLNSPQ